MLQATLDSVAMAQHCAIEVTAMMEMFEKWLLSTGRVASSVNEELNFSLYFTVIQLNLNSQMQPVAIVLKSTALDQCFANLNVI